MLTNDVRYKRLICFGLFLPSAVLANNESVQRIEGLPVHRMNLEAYIKLVQENNIGIENQKLAVDSAIANKSPMSAPNLNPFFTYSRGSYYGQTPYTPYVAPASNTYALQITVEGWGKRSARSNVAESEIQKSQFELHSAKNNVELDASFAYLDALRPKLNAMAYLDAINQLQRIKTANSAPLIEQYTNKEQQEARSYKYFMLSMLNLAPKTGGFLVEPVGRGVCKANEKKLNELISNAMDKRADLISSNESVKVADHYVELAKANRNIDITPSVWTSRTPSYNDLGSNYGATSAFGFSIQVPIPTNLITDTSVAQAINSKEQAQNNRNLLQTQVQTELRQAVMQYETAINSYRYAAENYQNAEKAYPPNTPRNIQTRTDYQLAMIDARINHSKALIFLMNKSGHYNVATYCDNQ